MVDYPVQGNSPRQPTLDIPLLALHRNVSGDDPDHFIFQVPFRGIDRGGAIRAVANPYPAV